MSNSCMFSKSLCICTRQEVAYSYVFYIFVGFCLILHICILRGKGGLRVIFTTSEAL